MSLSEFLAKKSEFYSKIDPFVAFRIFEKYQKYFKIPPIIHIVGTNGKGSTGRFLAQLLEILGYEVGHYSSPHLFEFRERFYLKKGIVDEDLLEKTHQKLSLILQKDLEKLSYFEYATFLAALLFEKCDFVIFEAGLGGEYDATSVFKKRLSIFTQIDYDHEQFLGNTLEKIARTKLKTMAKKALISTNQNESILKMAQKIALLKGAKLCILKDLSSDLLENLEPYKAKFKLPLFLENNLKLALKACEILLSKSQTIKALQNLTSLNLRGRLEKLKENLYIDVGHNVLAARALCEYFKDEKIEIVYNGFLDKKIFEILKILKPISARIMVFKCENEVRALANEQIFEFCKELNIECEEFKRLDEGKKTLVFGSFVLVEKFLKDYGA
ncbi:Mur ligase family protein [Campylobacter vulpis]|uniref:Folylpolyglutamate synthase n=1 Tax=Campylobacter vulpis TaxID=1655500 RepID=A0A2G4R3G1_9BACT|nr:Mur ligase family protein [Campylobacter vulpis]MBS4331269.1 bifunctional folylpolyglutamate synthase/dihydrofolate synthase [Campylobacter vulpis]MBS4406726.1 bifunctional folylpolyglutamate synthase/dihydrofolate synthase [Campylobacter vulpis]MBS4439217.1 bifunctional folylpolyglutamate synthase/dihydrofolate synthase [Campylobacter vulpis]PHY90345.1 folylpolyglutamate synthase [Campylobacter vulpis]